MLRAIEISVWISGLFLLGTYFTWRAWSTEASAADIQKFNQVRAQLARTAPPPATRAKSQKALQTFAPDTSLWSRKRLEEYQQSLPHAAAPLAVLRIPRLGLQVPVYEGTDDFALNRGAGHIAGTADLASASGNTGIAAHRDGFFRPLKDIAMGEELLVDSLSGTHRYTVTLVHVVDPSDVSVLDPTPRATLTLVTCYPFYFVGSAPKRFIVRAEHASESRFTTDP